MKLQSAVMNGMLKGITDPRLRETYGAILNGDFPYIVYCMDPKDEKHKSGVKIGYIDKRGRCIDEPVVKKGEIISGIETSRDRLDGRKGFRCYCGNWSIQCAEELGVIKQAAIPMPPTREDLQEIFSRLQNSGKRQGMEFINGVMDYDGFRVEEVRE